MLLTAFKSAKGVSEQTYGKYVVPKQVTVFGISSTIYAIKNATRCEPSSYAQTTHSSQTTRSSQTGDEEVCKSDGHLVASQP